MAPKRKEQFHIDEYNSFEEMKSFEAVEYYKVKEEPKYNENFKVEEASASDVEKVIHKEEKVDNKEDKTEKKKENNNRLAKNEQDLINNQNNLMDKIRDLSSKVVENCSTVLTSVSGIAVGTVAVVITCSNYVSTSPNAKFTIAETGQDYIAYTVDVADLNEDVKYYIEISSNGTDYRKEIPTIGQYSDIITGLMPNRKYEIKFVGENGLLGDITFDREIVYTLPKDEPVSSINLTYYNETSLSYDVYVSDKENYKEGYYMEVLYNGQSIYGDEVRDDGLLNGNIYDLEPGDYEFRIIGFESNDQEVIVSKVVTAPFEIKYPYIQEINEEFINDELIFDSKIGNYKDLKNKVLTYELTYILDNDEEITTYGTLEDISELFVIKESVPLDAYYYSYKLKLNDRLVYSKNDVWIDRTNVNPPLGNNEVNVNLVENNQDITFEINRISGEDTLYYELYLYKQGGDYEESSGELEFINDLCQIEYNAQDFISYRFYVNDGVNNIYESDICELTSPKAINIAEVNEIGSINIKGEIKNADGREIKIELIGYDENDEVINYQGGENLSQSNEIFDCMFYGQTCVTYEYQIYVGDDLIYSKSSLYKAVRIDNLTEYVSNELDGNINILFDVIDYDDEVIRIEYYYIDPNTGDETSSVAYCDVYENKVSSMINARASTYHYNIFANDKLIHSELSKQYEPSLVGTINHKLLNEHSVVSLNDDGTINIVIDTGYVGIEGFKVKGELFYTDEYNDNIGVESISENGFLRFENIPLLDSYLLEYRIVLENSLSTFYYSELYVEDGNVGYNNVYYEPSGATYLSTGNQFEIAYTLINLNENVTYDLEIVVTYPSGSEEKFTKSHSSNDDMGQIILTVPSDDRAGINVQLTLKHNIPGLATPIEEVIYDETMSLSKPAIGEINYNKDEGMFEVNLLDYGPDTTIRYTFNGINHEIEGTSLMNNILQIPFEQNGTNELVVYYVFDGDRISLDASKTFNYVEPVEDLSQLYTMNATNPGDVKLNYIDDNTVELIFDVNFTTTDESIYYSVGLVDYDNDETSYYESNDYSASFQIYIEDRTKYGLIYTVYRKGDGVNYILSKTIPSGSVEINGFRIDEIESTTLENDTFTIKGSIVDPYDIAESISFTILDSGTYLGSCDYTFIDGSNEFECSLENIPTGTSLDNITYEIYVVDDNGMWNKIN